MKRRRKDNLARRRWRWMYRGWAFAAAIAAVAAPVGAQPVPCAPDYATAQELLTGQHGEVPVGYGLTSVGHLMTLWLNPATGAWSATVTAPTGQTCMPAFGHSWQDVTGSVPGSDG